MSGQRSTSNQSGETIQPQASTTTAAATTASTTTASTDQPQASTSRAAQLPPPSIRHDISDAERQFNCVICLSIVTDPRLCCKCAKIFCFPCLATAYVNSRSPFSCPHCRAPAPTIDSFIRVPWVEEHASLLKHLTTRIADECQLHSGKPISVFCNDCNKTACSTCWTNDHTDHKVIPIEAANDKIRERISNSSAFTRMKNLGRDLEDFNRKTLLNHDVRYNRVKREVDQRLEELTRTAKEVVDRECAAMYKPISACETGLVSVSDAFRDLQRAAADSHLNRLVDTFDYFTDQVSTAEKDAGEAVKIMRDFQPTRKEALHILSPWLPGWDLKERITVKRRLLSSPTDPKNVARFTVNDISWCVWVGNRDRVIDEESAFPLGVMIYAVMEGRESLRDYELCIVHEVGDPSREKNMQIYYEDDSEHEGPDYEGDSYAVDTRRKKVGDFCANALPKSEVVCRSTFTEGEKLFFSVEDPDRWLNAKGELDFVFKVRPLTYKQKLRDVEFYYQRILNGRHNTTSVTTPTTNAGSTRTDVGATSSSSSSSPTEERLPKDKKSKDRMSKGKRKSSEELPPGGSSGVKRKHEEEEEHQQPAGSSAAVGEPSHDDSIRSNVSHASSGSSGQDLQVPPDYVLNLAERQGLTEEAIRCRLRGNLVSTIQLIAHFKRNNSALRQDQLVSVMGYYLRRITPPNRRINGSVCWSLPLDGEEEG